MDARAYEGQDYRVGQIFGTDIGPECACGGTVYRFEVELQAVEDGEPTHSVTATCVGCGFADSRDDQWPAVKLAWETRSEPTAEGLRKDLETKSEGLVLKWCRDGRKQGRGGLYCMRVIKGLCKIVDNARFSSPVIVEGKSWLAVWTKICAEAKAFTCSNSSVYSEVANG
jgi:hypothetical protein